MLLSLLALTACGGGGGGGTEENENGTTGTTIEGAVVDPPIIDATVYVCNASVDDCNASTAIKTKTTEDFGKYSVTVPDPYSPPFIIKVEGGKEDTDGDNEGDKNNTLVLYSLVYNATDGNYNSTEKKATAHVTPLTTMVYAVVKKKNATGDPDEIKKAVDVVKQSLGLNATNVADKLNIFTTPPTPALLDENSTDLFNATIVYRAASESIINVVNDNDKFNQLAEKGLDAINDEIAKLTDLTEALNETISALKQEIQHLKEQLQDKVDNVEEIINENATQVLEENNAKTVNATDPTKIPNEVTLSVTPPSVTLPESETDPYQIVTFTVTVKNVEDHSISNASVTLKCDDLNYTNSSQTDEDGKATFTFNATKNHYGTYTFNATSDSKSGTATLIITKDPIPTANNYNATVKINGTLPIKVTDFASDNDNSTLKIIDVQPKSDNLNWTATEMTYNAPNEVTTETFNCTVQDSAGQNATATITINVVENPAPDITLSKTSVSVDQGKTTTVTVKATDEDGIKEITATSSNSSVATVELASSLSDSVTLTIKGISSGNANITVNATDNLGASSTKTIAVTVVEAPPTQYSVTISPNSTSLSTGNSTTFVVKVQDASGNPVENTSVTLSATGGTLNPSSGTTNSAGQVEVTYTAPASAGTYTITATAGGVSKTATVTVTGGTYDVVRAVLSGGQWVLYWDKNNDGIHQKDETYPIPILRFDKWDANYALQVKSSLPPENDWPNSNTIKGYGTICFMKTGTTESSPSDQSKCDAVVSYAKETDKAYTGFNGKTLCVDFGSNNVVCSEVISVQ
jgi:ElaB/YqjD/DUF883 family membrane-anchored ribosome-binding protein